MTDTGEPGRKTPASSRLLMGRIGAAQGIRGEVRITPFTADPLALAGYGPLETDRAGLTVTISNARLAKSVLVARIEGVSDRNAAEKLNGVGLYVERENLPPVEHEDDFYHADLIGLAARLADGTLLGEVIAVPNFGAGDLLEVRDRATGATSYFPFTRAAVPEIRLRDGFLTIAPPDEIEGEAPDGQGAP